MRFDLSPRTWTCAVTQFALFLIASFLVPQFVDAQENGDDEEPKILSYRVHVLELPSEAIEDLIAGWQVIGASSNETLSPAPVQQASATETSRTYETRCSGTLDEVAYRQIIESGQSLSRPNLMAENGDQAEAQVGRSIPFVAAFVPKKGEEDSEVPELEAKMSTVEEGIKLSLTGQLDENAQRVLMDFEFSDTDLLSMDHFTYEADGRTLTVDQPSIRSSSIHSQIKMKLNEVHAICQTETREVRAERRVPVVSAIPYVGRLFKNTAIGTEKVSTVVLLSCELAQPGQTFKTAK